MTSACRVLERAARGDQLAFAELYDLTSPCCYRLARCLTDTTEEADALMMCAYLEAWRTASSFDATRQRAIVWLLAIVRTSWHAADGRVPDPDGGGT